MIDSARWQRMQSPFNDALDLPPSEHESFLRAACGDDVGLCQAVLEMLEQDSKGSSLLDRAMPVRLDSG